MLRPLDLPLADIQRMDVDLVRLARGDVRERLFLGDVLRHLGLGFRDHGFRTFAMYVRERASQKVGWCTEARALALRLASLPVMREALQRGELGWSKAVLLSRYALLSGDDEVELLSTMRGRTIRDVRRLLEERKRAAGDDERESEVMAEDEDELDPLVTVDLAVGSREELLAIEGVRLAIEHVNAGQGETGEWFECLLFEGASSLMDRVDVELPDVRAQVEAARETRRLAQEVIAHAETGARPTVTPVLEEVRALEGVDLSSLDGVALDRLVGESSARLASRDVWLGRLLSRLLLARGWERLGYASEQHYFDERLGMSRSSARARVTMARRSVWLEKLDEALERGAVGYEHASLIARVATPDTLQAWITRAGERTFKHLREDVRAAGLLARIVGDSPVGVMPPSEEELDAVFDFERRVVSGEMIASATRMSRAVGRKAGDAEGEGAEGEGVEGEVVEGEVVQMSATPKLRPAPYSVRTREEVALYYRALDAAYRESGRPGTLIMFSIAAFWREWGERFQHGNKWKVTVFDRDRHRCTSPVCESRVCTNHHVRYRSHGGGDEAENQITACDFCHLEGEHGGRLTVRGTASRPVWVFGRTPILRVDGRTKTAA